ncbi:molybdenum cofactor guanylyltransferase [Rariglobus hedericola]|nr:molybdenum cofactor guanylyltransferase [Rariglobus hedericola]
MPDFAITGAILAGGRSSRMGRDKAFLPFPAPDGPPLIAHQAALLRSLGITDLIISGRLDTDYATTLPNARVVHDTVPDAGPLAGLIAILAAASHPWVLILAVDLPQLTPTYLQKMISTGGGRIGVVPYGPHGYEPLAGLYPRTLLPRLQAALDAGHFRLQKLLHESTQEALIKALPLEPAEIDLFSNWNTPADAGI